MITLCMQDYVDLPIKGFCVGKEIHLFAVFTVLLLYQLASPEIYLLIVFEQLNNGTQLRCSFQTVM